MGMKSWTQKDACLLQHSTKEKPHGVPFPLCVWLVGCLGGWVGLFCVSFLDCLLLRKSRCTVLA